MKGDYVTDIVKKTAEKLNCRYLENASMRDFTSFKTGGNADIIVFPDSIASLTAILKACRENEIKTYIIGNGSNILVSDNGLSGVVIKIGSDFSNIELADENTIVCESGISMAKLCSFSLENSLSGLEFAFGIPGTAGGAAFMNAGAYGGEMKDVLVECTHIDNNLNIGKLSGDELGLSYRKSAYSDNGYIITSLKLRLEKSDKESIKAKMYENLGKRKEKQPLEFPSAGSTFKRPEGYFAGTLIEECALKGYSIGGAQVSEKHAGFVINKGNATSTDIASLIDFIRKTVYENKGVMLEPEVRFLGEF